MSNIEEAAKNLKKAMKGLGTNEGKIIKEICDHNNLQRQQIKEAYFNLYHKSLEEELKSEISGRFLESVLLLLKRTDEFEAECLNKAMKGLGTNEKLLIELLCTKNGYELEVVSNAYKKLYQKDLSSAVASEVSGDFGKLLKSLASCSRDKTFFVDQKLANNEANDLYKAGEGRLGTNETKFIQILSTRNFLQLQQTFNEYFVLTHSRDIEKSVKNEMSGDLERALVTIIRCVRNRPLYFAELLHEAMSGLGTKDDALMRILITRSDIDLQYIKVEYQRRYNKSLYDAVKSELSGDYEKLFLRLIGQN